VGLGLGGRPLPTERRAHHATAALAGTGAVPAKQKRSHDEMEDGNGGALATGCAIQASEAHAQKVLRRMYAQQRGDFELSVRLNDDTPATTFDCCSALLAGASPVFETLLFGSFARPDLLAGPRSERVVEVSGHEPKHVELLLRFIHGEAIAFPLEESGQLYALADYYEVLPLCDYCVEAWRDDLSPSNCVSYLVLARNVGCEALERVCLDSLTLLFSEVVERDSSLHALPADVLMDLVQRDSLMCAHEEEVLGALLKWYCTGPLSFVGASVEAMGGKRSALLAMLSAVRWDHVLTNGSTPWFPGRQAYARGASWWGNVGLVWIKLRELVANYFGVDRRAVALDRDATRTYTDLEERAADVASDLVAMIGPHIQQARLAHGGPRPPAALFHASPPRLYCWGKLLATDAPGNPTKQFPSEGQVFSLHGHKQFVAGRSRHTDIRFGQNNQLPYVSSRHFKLLTRMTYPERSASPSAGHTEDLRIDPKDSPHGSNARLTVFLTDTSQNGTLVNGELVGKDTEVRLSYGDKIQVVFTHETLSTSLPSFTFHPPSFVLPPPPAPAAE